MADEKTIHDVPVPYGVTGQMVAVGKYFVTNKLKDGFTKEKMFKHFSMSSKTFYKWLENKDYQGYITAMECLLLPEDELEAVRKMKKKIMAFADKSNVSASEMKLFADVFGYIFQADAKIQSEKLGLTNSNGSSVPVSVDEKKSRLLERLKG
jgi:hypothetical protein